VLLKKTDGQSLTICLATYNGETFLREQIDSILLQLGQNDRLIVSDDGSSDNTVAILQSYGEKLTIVSTKRIGGVVQNFSRVLAAATGDYIALADQDDVWLPGRTDMIRAALADYDLVQLNGEVVDSTLASKNITVYQSVNVRPGLLQNFIKNSFVGCNMAFRRELRDFIMPMPKNIPWHDWYIGLAAEAFFRVKRIDTVSMLYRRHGDNFSETGGKSNYGIKKKIMMRYFMLSAMINLFFKKKPSQKR